MVDIPRSKMSGKNSADIRMVVDAMDLCYSKQHIDVFAPALGRQRLLSARLQAEGEREADHRRGVKSSTSGSAHRRMRRVHLLRRPRPGRHPPETRQKQGEAEKRQARGGGGPPARDRHARWGAATIPLWGSLVKQRCGGYTPGSPRATTGTAPFSDLLEDVAERGLIRLEHDQERGNYKVRPATR